jgi:cytosine/adenosine deaminase-related metal-dependent hydrolase
MNRIWIQGGRIITMNPAREIFSGDILIEGDRIKYIGKKLKPSSETKISKTIDARSFWVLPGFIQTHTHLCQTLLRNQAEGLTLLNWLKKKVWPYEAALTKEKMRMSAELGIMELLKSGTTTILDMGSVHHTDIIFDVCRRLGIRAFSGKAMMDEGNDVPETLKEKTEESIEETWKLIEKWHGAENGRLQYALAPRFVLSCSQKLLKKVSDLSEKNKILIHTHASENEIESKIVKKKYGLSNIRYLNKIGLCGRRSIFAHCIWLDEKEMELLSSTQTSVAHCPTSNLKLASGIARIPEMTAAGIRVTLGADGAPCNNNLDMLQEMRLAGLIHRVKYGVAALASETILAMATIEGAAALGMEKEIGSLEVGKKADLILVNQKTDHTQPIGSDYDTLIYAAKSSDVDTVIVDGKILVPPKQRVS